MKQRNSIVIFVLGVFFINFVEAQIVHSSYFPVLAEDLNRWESYADFLVTSQLDPIEKADSVYSFAEVEYQNGQFSKSRELCEIANDLNPDLSKTHLLIGKSYVSSAEKCQEGDLHNIKEGVIWAAIDEWEQSISKPGEEEKREAKILIERYSDYLPTGEHFRSCFSRPTAVEGDEYFVECWIQKMTHIRFKKGF
ncbi:hypothetical protein [Lewinella cohaerens]|uniref:hypothetical protein n=1 Tax=Lewinella cohaerens TaxID=70995 RepID=UPI00038248EF|nr:hypothetical protein [Lewinella cohaerens]